MICPRWFRSWLDALRCVETHILNMFERKITIFIVYTFSRIRETPIYVFMSVVLYDMISIFWLHTDSVSSNGKAASRYVITIYKHGGKSSLRYSLVNHPLHVICIMPAVLLFYVVLVRLIDTFPSYSTPHKVQGFGWICMKIKKNLICFMNVLHIRRHFHQHEINSIVAWIIIMTFYFFVYDNIYI